MDVDWGDIAGGVAFEFIGTFDGRFELDRTTSIARFGTKVVDCTLINDARLEVEQTFRSRNLALVFGVRGTSRLVLPLRQGKKEMVDESLRESVIAMLDVSSIGMPHDPFDPKGRYARSGFPTNVTRDEAIELVRNPPMPGDPLPIIQ
ncbi:MAG: hypothetical protein ACOH1T_01250 [Microbacteriaceae bacterium]